MNVADQINAVARQVAKTGEKHVVVVEQTFPTSPADLWDACTNPDRLPRWFEPVDGDLHQGGRYRLADSGTAGTIEHCKAPTALRITWEYGGDTSHVDVTITESGSHATLTLQHTVPDDDHWQTYGPAAAGIGWDSSFLALAFFIADDPRATPEQMATFSTSEEGHEFITATATSWERAHIASGVAPRSAHEAAKRTADFYRGQD